MGLARPAEDRQTAGHRRQIRPAKAALVEPAVDVLGLQQPAAATFPLECRLVGPGRHVDPDRRRRVSRQRGEQRAVEQAAVAVRVEARLVEHRLEAVVCRGCRDGAVVRLRRELHRVPGVLPEPRPLQGPGRPGRLEARLELGRDDPEQRERVFALAAHPAGREPRAQPLVLLVAPSSAATRRRSA